MKKFLSIQGSCRVAMAAALALAVGQAHADTTGAQVEAMGRTVAAQMKEFLIGTLSACVAAYPEVRGNALQAMEVMVPKLKSNHEVADQWIQSIGQCMDKRHVLSREQCGHLETSIRSGKFDSEAADMKPIIMMYAPGMLQPCINKR